VVPSPTTRRCKFFISTVANFRIIKSNYLPRIVIQKGEFLFLLSFLRLATWEKYALVSLLEPALNNFRNKKFITSSGWSFKDEQLSCSLFYRTSSLQETSGCISFLDNNVPHFINRMSRYFPGVASPKGNILFPFPLFGFLHA
jgi:hypothetical protein